MRPTRVAAPRAAVRWGVPICLVALLLGCAGAERRDRANGLVATSNFYMKAMRWGEYQAALGLMRAQPAEDEPPRDPEARPPQEVVDAERLDSLERVRVVSAEHELTALDDDALTAAMRASFSYHIGNSTRIESTVQTGTWWFDEAEEAWYFDAELPAF